MALLVDAKKCESPRVKANLFAAGVILMALGFREVTEKTVDEVAFRMRVYEALFGSLGNFGPEELVGLSINGTNETAAAWMSRTRKNFLRDFDNARRRAAEKRAGGIMSGARKATEEEMERLQKFALDHGARWREKLHDAWRTGQDATMEDGYLLRRVRNNCDWECLNEVERWRVA